jgi:hypothetical protein
VGLIKKSSASKNYFYVTFQDLALEQNNIVLSEQIGFGNYYRKLENLYRVKDFKNLAILFPDYEKYAILIKELVLFKSQFYRNEILQKKNNGSWCYSRILANENYDTKKGESLELEMLFDQLELNPQIKSIRKISRKSYKINRNNNPPPDPMSPPRDPYKN